MKKVLAFLLTFALLLVPFSTVSFAATSYTDVTLTGTNGWSTAVVGNEWHVYLTTSGFTSPAPSGDEAWAWKYTGFTYEYNGSILTTGQVSSADNNNLFCTIPTSVVPATGGTFTIKAGQYEPEGGTDVGLNIVNDITIAAVDGRLTATTVMYADNVETFGGNANSFYFSLKDSSGTPLPTDYPNWDYFLSPSYCDKTRIDTAGWTTTYSGVFQDGQPIDYYGGNFKNPDPGNFYINGLNATVGTEVVVRGHFTVSTSPGEWIVVDDYYFKELKFTFDGTNWVFSRDYEYTNVNFTGVLGEHTKFNGSSWVVYLNTNGFVAPALSGDPAWAWKYQGFTYEYNGETGTTTQVSSADENRLYFTIPRDDIPDGAEITIKAGQYNPDSGNMRYGLNITEDFTLVALDGYLISPKFLDTTNVEAFNGNANSFYFSLKDSSGAPITTGYESWEEYFVSPAQYDGSRLTQDNDPTAWTTAYSGVFQNGQPVDYWAGTFKNPDPGTFFINGLNATVGTEVVVRGYFAVSTTADWVVKSNYYLKEIKFVYDGSAWSVYKEINYTEYEGTPVFKELGAVEDGELKGFYFTAGETAFPYSWETSVYAADDEESGVFLNGEKTSVFLKKVTEDSWYVCLSDARVVPENGDEITIVGSFIYDTHRITFEEYTFTYETEEPVQKYTGTPVLGEEEYYGSAAGFYFHSEDGAPFATDWSLTYNAAQGDDNGVFLNGVKTEIFLKKINTNVWYVCITDVGVTPNADDVITIKGDFVVKDGTDTVTFNEAAFEFNGRSFSAGEIENTGFTITGLDYQHISYNSDLNRWNLYFKLSNNVPGACDATYYSFMNYEINGVEYKQHWFKAGVGHVVDGEMVYDIYIPISQIPGNLDQEYVITLKAYTAQARTNGTNEPLPYGISLTEEFQFVLGGNYTSPAPAIDYTMANGGNGNGIYLSAVDSFPVTGWDYNLTKVGTDSGVYVDGELTEVFLKKYEDGKYYVCLVDEGYVAQEGTIVMVKGAFTIQNLNTVKFQTAKYIYKDGQWKTYSDYTELPSTGVTGDANGDGAFNVLDLIRIKKFALGAAQEIGADADLNGDGKFNASDLTLAIRILLDITTYVDGSNITGVPTYEDDAEMRLSAYVSPDVDGFADYKAAGFTTLLSEYVAVYGEDNFADYMNAATENDLDVIVQSGHMQGMFDGTVEYNANWLSEMYNDVSKYESFRGIFMGDEPRFAQLDNYAKVATTLRSFDSDMDLFTSCLPTYTPDEQYIWADNNLSLAEKYSNYANAFGNLFGDFTYDFYPFKHSYSSFIGMKFNEKDYMRSDWFQNLSLAATNAKGAYDTGITVQSYSEELNAKDHYREVTQADVSFQVYSALAYGMKSINYFTYGEHWDPNVGTTSCMIMNGQKTAVYEAVKNVNHEIKAFDHVLLNFNWQGTIGISGDDSDGMMDYVASYTSKRISAYSASNDAIIGCLKDSKGYDGFMLVNSTDPSDKVTETISVTFKNADHAKVYINGVESIVTLDNGTYSATLAPGQGIFVIPYIA